MNKQLIKTPGSHDWCLIQVFSETLTHKVFDITILETSNGEQYKIHSYFKYNLKTDIFPYSHFILATGQINISAESVLKAYNKSEFLYFFVCEKIKKG